jgi:hypothetical protein
MGLVIMIVSQRPAELFALSWWSWRKDPSLRFENSGFVHAKKRLVTGHVITWLGFVR